MYCCFGATLIGRGHRRVQRGGQDAWAARPLAGGGWAAAVADGCSAGRATEIGAGVGARAALASVARRRRAGASLEALPRLVLDDVVSEIARLARAMALDADDAAQVVEDALLFTLHVAVLDAAGALAFGVGDGLVIAGGARTVIDQGEAPDYPAYALFSGMAPRLLVHHLAVGAPARAGDAEHALLLATDGACALAPELLDALLGDDRYARNPSLAQKRLHALVDEGGAPEDDCTVVVLRPAPPAHGPRATSAARGAA